MNKERGMKWLSTAAQMGSAHAMHDLAIQLGKDDKKTEALNWYHRAAALGLGESIEAVANYYYFGYAGLTKDCHKAYEWYEKAQIKGVELAFNNHAWYLSTSADEKCRNPEKAVVVFSELKQRFSTAEEMPWSFRDTEAAVLAGIADFSAAINRQQQLIKEVLSYDGDASQFELHLQRYEQRKPWIEN